MQNSFREWLLFLSRTKSDNTVNSYRKDLQLFVDDYQLNINDIYDFIAYKKKHLNDRSLARLITALKSFLSFLYENKVISDNIAGNIQQVKYYKPKHKTLSQEEILTFLKVVDAKNKVEENVKLVLFLIYATGMRISEALNIKKQDIYKQNIRVLGKGGVVRSVFIPTTLFKEMSDLLKSRKDEEYVFTNNGDTMLTDAHVRKILIMWRRNYNFPEYITPHFLRHAFASHLLEQNVDIRTIQMILGHKNLSSTQIYTHANIQHLIKEVNSKLK